MLWLIWMLVLIGALTLYFRNKLSRFSRHGLKSFIPLPLVGNQAGVLMRRSHFVETIERTYFAFPYERFVGHFEFMLPVVVIRDLDLIKKIAVKDFESFVDHRTFIDEKIDPLFGRNLLSLKGEEWKDMRSALSPAFTSSKIRLMVPFMMEVGDQMITALQADMRKTGLDYVDVDTKDLGTRFANDVIATCAFGLKVNSHADRDNAFYTHGKIASTFNIWLILKVMIGIMFPLIAKILKINIWSKETRSFFTNLVLNTMKNREDNKIIRPDMIHLLMEAKKGNLTHDEKTSKDVDAGFATVKESNVGKKSISRVWSDDDLVAQAMLFFFAGFETISTVMSFVLHELAVNPEIQERLYDEIKENEANNHKFDYNSVQNMTYLDMVVSEVLRLWPPAIATDRGCQRKYNLGKPGPSSTEDFYINKGEVIHIPIWAIHRDPQYYPDPLRFDPERFSEENKHKINPWIYAPFGLGPRNCIGSRFALCELKVMIYQLLLNMKLVPCEKTCIPSVLSLVDMGLRLKGGNWVRMMKRNYSGSSEMLWVYSLLVLIAAATWYFRRLFSRFSRYGVKNFLPFPLVGNQLDLVLKRVYFLETLQTTYFAFPFDRFVGHFDFIAPMVIVRDLELIKKITVKDFEHFIDHRSFIDDKADPLFGRNLFSLKGNEWKDMRSTLSPAFTSSKIRLMVPFMVEVGDQMIKALQDNMNKSGLGFVDIECKDLTTRYANDVIASCAFGLKVDSHLDPTNAFYRNGKIASNFTFLAFMKLLLGISIPLLAKIFKFKVVSEDTKVFFRSLVMDTMKNREENNIIRPDMIHLLMEAKKGHLIHDEKVSTDADAGFATVEESNVGRKVVNRVWSDDDLVAQAILFFLAGFDTVSTAMSFTLYELTRHPEIQERLYNEIRENEAKNGYKFDYNTIQNMKYLDMVVSEVLRLWPPAGAMERKCVNKYNLGKPNVNSTQDYYMNEGESVTIPAWAIHRDPQYYPDPLRFDPERFSEENKHKINPWSYGPFGLGPRNCIGSRFALCEVKVMVYQLLLNMELVPFEKTCIPPVLSLDDVNLRLRGGTWVRMLKRTA